MIDGPIVRLQEGLVNVILQTIPDPIWFDLSCFGEQLVDAGKFSFLQGQTVILFHNFVPITWIRDMKGSRFKSIHKSNVMPIKISVELIRSAMKND